MDIVNESENYTKARIELESIYKAVTAEASAKEAELLRRVADRVLGRRVDLDDDPVGADRRGGERQRLDQRAAPGRVRRVDDDR